MMRVLTSALVLWAGVAVAEDVAFFGGDLVLTLPEGATVGREFGQGDKVYAVELDTPTIETVWTQAGRADELPDMDRMEAAFGLTFPTLVCADIPETALALPTKCKNRAGISILVVPQSADDSGELLGNQMGLLAADVDALWAQGAYAEMLTVFCQNEMHAHRVEVSRDENSVSCISDRPALAPHFLSFRMMVDAEYAVVMYAQNIFAETDVIMTYGIDPFLALIEGASDIETVLLDQSEKYIAANGRDATYMLDVLAGIAPVQ